MFNVMQVATVILAGLSMVPAVAHALELPGKMRLDKNAYFAVQKIYYPGFTIAGIAEPAVILSTMILLFFTTRSTTTFSFALIALLGLVSMQAIYWIFIHPINRIWLQGETLSRSGSG